MKKSQIICYQDKKIKLFLNNGNIFTGHIEQLEEDSLTIIDKFQEKVTISLDSISLIKEEKNEL